ncbi:hypothetical protein [Shinella sp.]|uniref:hypothetical protein n=1 Tax=Shinella sp. TaxID=1870904 RepID=UPI002590A52B|nr:hypothetical protein [Shinella sp.]MCW5712263.1 hypothetical protein [Shinella sp.]
MLKAMNKQSASSLHFQRKISEFCHLRIAPVVSKRAFDNIHPYLVSLIIYRKMPPMRAGRIDWWILAETCGIEDDLTPRLKEKLRPGLEAIIRWIGKEASEAEDRPDPAESQHGLQRRTNPRARTKRASRSPRSISSIAEPLPVRSKQGPQPKPVREFPQSLFEYAEDPEGFREALIYHMRRHGETYWHLHHAIVRPDEAFDHKTLLSWTKGIRVPRSIESFDILSRIEKRYRLPDGYFKARLPHQSRSARGHDVGSNIGPAQRRRLAWLLIATDGLDAPPTGIVVCQDGDALRHQQRRSIHGGS